jgi:hypothetical protein
VLNQYSVLSFAGDHAHDELCSPSNSLHMVNTNQIPPISSSFISLCVPLSAF